MPYQVKAHEGEFCVFKEGEDTPGKGMCHPSKDEAEKHMAAMDASEPMAGKSDTLIAFGDSVKALPNGKLGGHLVLFTTPQDPDLTDDYFDAETDLGGAEKYPILYHHGLDKTLKRKRIGSLTAKPDEVGLWVEAQLDLRDDYEKQIYKMAKAGKLGWSSGAAAHTVEREQIGKAFHITQWFISEASLTPTPAEPRAKVIELKSLQLESPEADAKTDAAGTENETKQVAAQTAKDKKQMDEKEMKALADSQAAQAAAIAEQGKQLADVTKSLGEVVDVLKKEKTGGTVSVTLDEADRPFQTLADQCRAVKSFAISSGTNADPRLKRLSETKAASGAVVGTSSDGGFLVEPTLAGDILKPIHDQAPFSSRVRLLPVGGNSNYGWINGVDETNRATGSRWGGVRGYRLAEGNAPTSSKPKFRRINWELKKYGVLVYGTDELLADAAQWSAVVNQASAEELTFMVNDDIFNGDGAAGAKGIMQSGALVTVTRASASHVVYDDLVAMWARMDSRAKQNAIWAINTDVNPDLDVLAHAVGTGGLEPKFVGYDATGLMRIKGRPVIETEFNASLGTTGDLALLDLSQYLMWEKGGVQSAESIHVLFTTDETTFRFIYRADGQPALASPLTPYKGTGNTLSPFVVLS